MDMRAYIEAELRRRQERNPCYSLRAYAAALGTHHRTLAQILQSRRVLSTRSIRQFGRRLKLPPAAVEEACRERHAEVVRRVVGSARFRPDSRHIAVLAGIPVDQVNIALQRLLRRGELRMGSTSSWNLSSKAL